MRARAAVLSACLLAVAVAPAAGAVAPTDSRAESRPARLGATVTVSGTANGSVPVVVPREARLGNPFITRLRSSVTITGGGEIAAFALLSDDPEGTKIVGGYSAATQEIAQKIGAFVLDLGDEAQRTRDGEFVVPPGRYRLHLITGGKPTTVVLRLGGLSGATRLSPTQRSAAVVHGDALTATTPLSYSGGHATRTRTPFLQFSVAKVGLSAHTESVGRSCFYIGRPSGPNPYGPACASPPDGSRGPLLGSGAAFVVSDEFVGQGTYLQYGGVHLRTTDGSVVRSDVGAGFSFTGGALVDDAHYAHVWLPL